MPSETEPEAQRMATLVDAQTLVHVFVVCGYMLIDSNKQADSRGEVQGRSRSSQVMSVGPR